MVPGLAEWAPVALAVELGQQLLLLDPPDLGDADGFLLVPVLDPAAADHVKPEFEDLLSEADARYDTPGGTRVTTWCKIQGRVDVQPDRLAGVVGAGIWDRPVVEAAADEEGVAVVFLDPHELDSPVVVDVTADRGDVVDLDVDLDLDRVRPVLAAEELRNRHNLLKTALGMMV